MKIEAEIPDINRDEVIEAMARQILTLWTHDCDPVTGERTGSPGAARTIARDLSWSADQLNSNQNFAEIVEAARECLRGGRADFEVLAPDFASAIVRVSSTCRMGLPCEEHGGVVHGQEAEELRAGVERIIRSTSEVPEDAAAFALETLRRSLIFLLDVIDARDSLAFREMTDPPEDASALSGVSAP